MGGLLMKQYHVMRKTRKYEASLRNDLLNKYRVQQQAFDAGRDVDEELAMLEALRRFLNHYRHIEASDDSPDDALGSKLRQELVATHAEYVRAFQAMTHNGDDLVAENAMLAALHLYAVHHGHRLPQTAFRCW
jgi:hypothetical protein